MGDLLVQGIGSSLKTLIIATFRAPRTSPAMVAFTMLNPTHTLIQSCWQMILDNPQLLVLLIFFNVNLDALNISNEPSAKIPESSTPHALLHTCAANFCAMDQKVQSKVLKLLKGSGNLPVTRDMQSFNLVMGMLGAMYKAEKSAIGRADAKGSASAPEAKGSASAPGKDEGGSMPRAGSKGGDSGSDAKQSKGQPSAAAESKGEKAESKTQSLLGDLPSLIPTKLTQQGLCVQKKDTKKISPSLTKGYNDPNVPAAYKCAINGHIMKEPVKGPQGYVFERGTIEYWLEEQGSVCPITGETVTADDLVVQTQLKRDIQHWHIKQSMSDKKDDNMFCQLDEDDDDLYDF